MKLPSVAIVTRAVALLMGACLASQAAELPASLRNYSGIQTENMDRAVPPQNDLYAYANGTWIRETPIPPDRSRYGIDSIVLEQSLIQQRGLLEGARHAHEAGARKAGALYASYMNLARLDQQGVAPLLATLKRAGTTNSLVDVSRVMGYFARIGIASPIELYVQPDAKNSSRYALWINQSGLGLPERNYYSNEAPRFAEVRSKYLKHVAALLHLAGQPDAEKQAADILALETSIARIHWNVVDRRNPEKTYNPKTIEEIKALAPSIDWDEYLSAAGVKAPWPRMIVRQPDYLQHVSELLRETPFASLREYLRFRLLSDTAPYLPSAFAQEDFDFNEGVLHDTPKIAERWKRAVVLVDQLLGDASGKLYVERYFPESSKKRVDQLVENLFRAYADSIENLDWLSPVTRAQALVKLSKIEVRVGYPSVWRDYSALNISEADLLGNVTRAKSFEFERQIAKLAHPVDRTEWEMTAPTVDAAYNASTNSIEFPAGVLQLYDPADDAYNYGSTGSTIGHEISHAFDSRGSRYDGDGALRDWWSAEDQARYKAKTDQLVQEFDAFEPIPGFHVNGALTLPENIADLVGLEIAYKAYIVSLRGNAAPVIDGLTGAQRFFIGYAQSFLGKRREALLIAQLKSNPHAPEKERVNGIVVNMNSFYDTFDVHPGDKMYLPPEKRVTLW